MQEKYPKKITLKGGKVVELRLPENSHEEELIRFFSTLPRESTEYLKDDVRDPEVVKRFVQQRDPNKVWCILAFDKEGHVVGDATLHMVQHGWWRHLGEVRVVVAPEYRKQRLATSLIHELVNHASLLELKKLEAQVLDSQLGARKALERLGFRVEATLKDHAQDLDNRLHDLLILTNTVDDLWRKMEDMISDLEIARDGY